MTCNPTGVVELPNSNNSTSILIVRTCLTVQGADVLTGVTTDATLTGNGTVASPLHVVGGGGLVASQVGDNFVAAEAILPGAPVRYSSVDHVVNAEANIPANAHAIGVAPLGAAPAGPVFVAFQGSVTLTTAQWDAVTGQVGGLTSGARYYLDPTTAGRYTTVAPSTPGQAETIMLKAMSTVRAILVIQPAIPL